MVGATLLAHTLWRSMLSPSPRLVVLLAAVLLLLHRCCAASGSVPGHTAAAAGPRVVVVEEHHHALPYWYDAARRAQRTADDDSSSSSDSDSGVGPRLLVHIDTHDDLALPRSGGFAPWTDAAAPANHFITRNDCFILDAVVRGLIDEIIFVRLVHQDESDAIELKRRRPGSKAGKLVALPHYSGVVRIGVVMHRHIGAFPPSLWTEGAARDSPAAVPVWCVCGDPAGMHSGEEYDTRAYADGNRSGRRPPCYYNENQALQDPGARSPEEIAKARQWGEKSEMAPLPGGTFCNLAKGWREGKALEWPSDGMPMGSSMSAARYQDEAAAAAAEKEVLDAGGVHEATVHVGMLLRERGQGRVVAQEMARAVRQARKHNGRAAPGLWEVGGGGAGDGAAIFCEVTSIGSTS